MAEQKAVETITLTKEQLSSLLEDVKKPYSDPVIKARIEKRRMQMRRVLEANQKARKEAQANCSHLRADSTSAIAWAEGSGYWDPHGVCQHCDRYFMPDRVVDGKFIKRDPDYDKFRAIPDRLPGTLIP